MKPQRIAFAAFASIALVGVGAATLGRSQDPAMPTATPEHALLKAEEGTWKAVGKMWSEPTGTPENISGVETSKLSFNGFWLVSDVKDDTGMYMGHSMTGYDPDKKKYVSASIDNQSAKLMTMEGTYDKAKNSFTWVGEAPDMTTGKMAKQRVVVTYPDKNTKHMEHYSTGADGKEFKAMELDFKRQ